MTDLTYITTGMFTRFIPQTDAGEDAWRTMAEKLNGDALVLNIHLKSTLSQLRKAGYKVKKSNPKPVTQEEINEFLNSLAL